MTILTRKEILEEGRTEGHNLAEFGARVRDYMEKAGLVIVQTSQISPDAYGGENGIWRMGLVDEGHEIFLTQDGHPTDI